MATTAKPAELLMAAGVRVYRRPMGAKMHILDLDRLEVDDGWIFKASNMNNRSPENNYCELIVVACLIEYPGVGLILFDTGRPEDVEVKWGAPLTDIFPRTVYTDKQKLPAAIKSTGNDIKDVKAIIMGHLHLDHAGGLEHFTGTDVPIYVHEEEFKHACWAVGTKADFGAYLPYYMNLTDLKWQTFSESHLDLYQGISLHHSPGHTLGLVVMQVNREKNGTFIWTTDQFHVKENYEAGLPQGWLLRDYGACVRSWRMDQRMQRLLNAVLIFGHDKDVAEEHVKYQAESRMLGPAVWH